MWKDKHGNTIGLLDTVSFSKDGKALTGRVMAVVEGDHILTIKVDRWMYYDMLDSDCELISHASKSSSSS